MYKYLIVNLDFSHLGFWWESFSDCAFSRSLPTCTFFNLHFSIQKVYVGISTLTSYNRPGGILVFLQNNNDMLSFIL